MKPVNNLDKSRINRRGLAVGTPAPLFRLPRVDGGELSLADCKGRRVLLVFTNPQCEPCHTLTQRLAMMVKDVDDPLVIMVSRGKGEVIRPGALMQGVSFPLLLQTRWEVCRQYATFSTPSGYLIDENGFIATELADSVEAIMFLARLSRSEDTAQSLEPVTGDKSSPPSVSA